MTPSTRPFFVGIAGGTGSGKTTVAHNLHDALPPDRVTLIAHDSYYRDRSGLPELERDGLNFDHPDALDNALLITQLEDLARGLEVEVPRYDFRTHTRLSDGRRVNPAPVVIVEGILIFAEPRIRDRFDVKIYVETDVDIRIFRRLRRDLESRGRTFAQVDEQYHRTVRPMHLEFVEPSRRWADILIPEGGNNAIALDLVVTKLQKVAAAGGLRVDGVTRDETPESPT
ncbi:MAG TPA: uridine kinase [Polyangiaceae bacterium]|nr:uridine kinase [Polyangiaceae bacterium]